LLLREAGTVGIRNRWGTARTGSEVWQTKKCDTPQKNNRASPEEEEEKKKKKKKN